MDGVDLEQVPCNLVANGLRDPVGINVVPDSNNAAATTTVGTTHPRSCEGSPLPACGMEHVPALETKHSVSMAKGLLTNGALFIHAFIDVRHRRFSLVTSPG